MLGDLGETRFTTGDREITVLGDRRDRVLISAHRIRPIITSAVWDDTRWSCAATTPTPPVPAPSRCATAPG